MTRAAEEALELAFAHGLPYAGLRDHHADPALTAVVPDQLARVVRVVVLRADGERVRLAAAEPQPDLLALADHLEGRDVEIAIAPRDEIEAILGPPLEAPPAPGPEPAPIEPVAEAAPEPEHDPPAAAEEPSWLAAAPAPSGLAPIVLVALAIVLLATGAAVAVWLAT